MKAAIPQLALSRHHDRADPCPLSEVERTSGAECLQMTQSGHGRLGIAAVQTDP
jgi:hypothetical protein